jgi:hypothetical protein
MTDFNELIPEMRDWNNGSGINATNWVACEGNFRLAVGYSAVFWLRFVEYEKYVLREGFSVESLRGFEQQCKGDRGPVESVMNHLHIADIIRCDVGFSGTRPWRLRENLANLQLRTNL